MNVKLKLQKFWITALNKYPHFVYIVPLGSVCVYVSITKHLRLRALGPEEAYKYKKMYVVKRAEDVELTEDNAHLYN
uniref:ATP synthase subunit epsilon, mitochondrial n=1 Tax=Schistosoma mansoni TaxID=6183 RepID=A0A5K4F785_SCHMA